jgi:hypothetical protein
MTARTPLGFTGPTPSAAKLAWQRDAACRTDPDLFWATDSRQQGLARHMCLAHCPVFDQCRAWAPDANLAESVTAGIAWAKDRTNGKSRPSLRQPVPVRCTSCSEFPTGSTGLPVPATSAILELRPCGTHAAYERHRINREPIDDACRRAEREYDTGKKRAARARQRTEAAA